MSSRGHYIILLTASLKVLGMNSLDDTPLLPLLQTKLQTEPHNLWMLTDSERKEVLKHITEKIVDRFISFQFHTDVHKSTDHVQEYGMQFLSLGCFYLEYSDAIRRVMVAECSNAGNTFWQFLNPQVAKTTPLKH